MNRQEFNKYWDTNYSKSIPIGPELTYGYSDRWFRIHNLPKSKRYAETEREYQIILDRQNELITDLIGENSEIIITSGQYEMELTVEIKTELLDFGKFEKCRTIELHKIYPVEYEDDFFYDVYFKPDVWKKNSKNDILRAIADDEFRALFICPIEKCIVAPYDGGMDIIVNSMEKRDELKEKYKNWLSDRDDGM